MSRFAAAAEVTLATILVVVGYKAAIHFRLSPFNSAPGALMIAGSVAGIVSHGVHLHEYGLRPWPLHPSHSRWCLALLLFAVVLPIAIALCWGAPPAPVIGWGASLVLCTGFGEELFFRGYVQSRLRAAFGRDWDVLGARCGPGLLISSFLFGAIHVFNPTRPYTPVWEFDPAWGLRTFCSGLLFGWLRERTGTIWAGVVLHALTGEYRGLWRLFGDHA